MKIEKFEVSGLTQYSYLISSAGQAIVIDPIRDFDRYTAFAAQHRLAITHVTETHIHADFASGAAALAQATAAELALSAHHEGQLYRYAMPHRPLRDSDEIRIGSVRLRAMHTPGHTPEHLSFLLFDEERSASVPAAIFTGDFLFVGSLGRPDLLGEDAKRQLARELYRSLHQRIASLPDGVQVYPGHGAGSLCGSGQGERDESTLGYERATQHLFSLDEATFLDDILASVPPMPSYYPRMKRLNAEGAPPISTLPAPRPLSPLQLAALPAQQQTIVLDLRRPAAFGESHIGGALNIGVGPSLSLWAGWLLDPTLDIILIGQNPGSSDIAEATLSLQRVGLDCVAGYLAGGMPAWREAGLNTVQTPQISTAVAAQDNALILDVRNASESHAAPIPGAIHIALGDLPTQLDQLPRDQHLITACGSGYRSSIAASLLQKNGFPLVSNLEGGVAARQAS